MTVNDPLVGRLLDGRYQIRARIATGGMATVYRATDTRLDRECAVKVMLPHLATDADFVERFIREAKSAARLSHPNVVGVFDQGQDGDVVFLAMEYVEGRTLRDLLDDLGTLTPREAFGVLEPMLAALGAAHRAGFVHRDIKPENVLISDDGGIKVADFGLARATATSSSAATGKVLVGTVAYLAPEQVERGGASPASDVYAAGIVLFEMLTGRQPHVGATAVEVIYKHVHADVAPPSAVLPGLASALDGLVLAATTRDLGLRPADADALLAFVRGTRHAMTPAELDFGAARRVVPPPRPDHDAWAPDTEMHRTRQVELPPDMMVLGLPSDLDAEDRRDEDRYGGPPPRADGRRSRKGVIALVVVLLLAVGIGVGAWWYGSGRYADVPAVVSLSKAEAERKVKDAGLKVHVETQFSETVPVDSVVGVDPGPGTRLMRGETVTLQVSRGPERYQVPELVGRSEEDARRILGEARLSAGSRDEQYHPEVPRGSVVSTDPAPGTRLAPDSAVRLVISRGPEPVDVPNVIGRTIEEARDILQGAGFNLAEAPEPAFSDVPEGRIAIQVPGNGKAEPGSVVTVTISKGQDLVELPDVGGKDVEEAKGILEGAGFEVETHSFPIGPRNVIRMDPGAGSMLPRGAKVTLWTF